MATPVGLSLKLPSEMTFNPHGKGQKATNDAKYAFPPHWQWDDSSPNIGW